MRTDKQVFQVFRAFPEWLFHLTGLPSPGTCSLQSFTVKALQRDTDGILVPVDLVQPITVAEFQFQFDETIYTRVVTEMAAVQEAYKMRAVQGLIIFGKDSLDPRTASWTQVVHVCVLPEVVANLCRSRPNHPIGALFQPLLQKDLAVLETDAVRHYRAIKYSKLDKRRRKLLMDVFVDWLEQRFPRKLKREIEIMLLGELPDLEETASGKELIAIGEKRGEKRGEERGEKRGEKRGEERMLKEAILLLLKDRFRSVPAEMEERIENLPSTGKKQLLTMVARATTLKDVEDWLRRRKT